MKRRRRALTVSLAVLIAFVGLSIAFGLALNGDAADYRGTALLGDPVPALTLPDLDGDEVVLRGLRGKAVIINFFNSWCIPCKEEEPALQAFFAEHRDESDFAMLGIVRDDTDAAIRKWAREREAGGLWTILLDPGAKASVDFGTTGQPETFAVSADGRIVGIQRGRATVDDLENMLALARGEKLQEDEPRDGERGDGG